MLVRRGSAPTDNAIGKHLAAVLEVHVGTAILDCPGFQHRDTEPVERNSPTATSPTLKRALTSYTPTQGRFEKRLADGGGDFAGRCRNTASAAAPLCPLRKGSLTVGGGKAYYLSEIISRTSWIFPTRATPKSPTHNATSSLVHATRNG